MLHPMIWLIGSVLLCRPTSNSLSRLISIHMSLTLIHAIVLLLQRRGHFCSKQPLFLFESFTVEQMGI